MREGANPGQGAGRAGYGVLPRSAAGARIRQWSFPGKASRPSSVPDPRRTKPPSGPGTVAPCPGAVTDDLGTPDHPRPVAVTPPAPAVAGHPSHDDRPTPCRGATRPDTQPSSRFSPRLANVIPVTGGHGKRRRPHPDVQVSAEDHQRGQPQRGRARPYDRSGTLLWTGAFDSFGSAASNERALGGVDSGGNYFGNPTSGAIAGWIAAAFRNCSGVALSGFAVSFDGKQWRDGGGTGLAPTMVFEYGFGATFGRVASWVLPGALFDFTSPIYSGTAGALDGNTAANRVAGIGGPPRAADSHPRRRVRRATTDQPAPRAARLGKPSRRGRNQLGGPVPTATRVDLRPAGIW